MLEIGAGIGNLTRALMPRDRYTATDINPHYLDYLSNFAESRPYLDVRRLDLADPAATDGLAGRYDTVVCLNVLEHVAQESQGARNLLSVLAPGGRAIVLVPQGPGLYGTLDRGARPRAALHHGDAARRRSRAPASRSSASSGSTGRHARGGGSTARCSSASSSAGSSSRCWTG